MLIEELGQLLALPVVQQERVAAVVVAAASGEIVGLEPASTWVDLTFNLGCAATVSLGQPRSNLTKVRL